VGETDVGFVGFAVVDAGCETVVVGETAGVRRVSTTTPLLVGLLPRLRLETALLLLNLLPLLALSESASFDEDVGEGCA